MIERLLEARYPIASALSVLKERGAKPPRNLKKKEWKLLTSLLSVLQPIRAVSDFLQTQVTPTFGVVFPIIDELIRSLRDDGDILDLSQATEEKPVLPSMIIAFKNSTHTHLDKRFNETKIEWDKELALSTFLDPRSKDFYFVTNEQERARLLSEAINLAVSETNVMPHSPLLQTAIPPVPSMTHLSTIMNLLGPNRVIPVLSDIGKELEGYRCLSRCSIDSDPLNWWRTTAPTFPKLAKLAQKYMAMMTSSASVERSFSLAGWIVDKRRCSLLDGTIEDRLILIANKQHLA